MAQNGSVLITVCSDDGIGSASAFVFQQHGYQVFATASDIKSMSKLEGTDNIKCLTLSVIQPGQIAAAVEAVKKETGGTLTYLVSNASRNRFMPLLDERVEDAKKLYDINVWGPLELKKAFFPLLQEVKETVVSIGSVSGYLNVPWQGVCAEWRRSIEMLADNLRVELKPFGVKVQDIITGIVNTKAHVHGGDWKLPENSLYASFRARGDDGAPRMEPMDYAKGVVPKFVTRVNSEVLVRGQRMGCQVPFRLVSKGGLSPTHYQIFKGERRMTSSGDRSNQSFETSPTP